MKKISIRNLGPIKEADIELGDLTILVGPQASGKSILLQIVKLLIDKEPIFQVLKMYGYVWDNTEDFLELYLGEGMAQVWGKATEIKADDVVVEQAALYSLGPTEESLVKAFYIPAQRVVTLLNGWPKPFSDFGNDPFVLKLFSETLRRFMDTTQSRVLFPGYADSGPRDTGYRSVFYNGELEVDVSGHRKRIVLNINGSRMPYLTWSAGQKEFMPLWLGINMLQIYPKDPSTNVDCVIIEEPEMGLHPQAIKSVILQVIDLMSRGIKVIISTHSPVLLEFAWAFKILQEEKANSIALQELFGISQAELPRDFFTGILHRTISTYFFERKGGGVIVKDISSLDAGSDDVAVADWGGLSSFASKAGEIVAKNVQL